MGSASELEYHLMLARDLGMLDATEYTRLTTDLSKVMRMLSGLIRSLRFGSTADLQKHSVTAEPNQRPATSDQ
jgi:hypothetical protein